MIKLEDMIVREREYLDQDKMWKWCGRVSLVCAAVVVALVVVQ